ncbi:acetyl-CoA C-acyltransferase [Parvibaculum sp.]|uniref:acetyl-CoA C-acyltransferase n=1 Tax=Parvibaculum sp. TaxID=2024848 RepID=UPI001B06EFB3|nr:acetyl-CoA C-acyltransferase [Parvibaculum sp.]MBO6635043.1 acetyl-CoA C-acyltransferase [Parvibaculum sp.]MBO6680115.1 acetyl-CoA C-acyltransferase [Parvibaculum sp.]MBO6686318.1 acetyl-CoA C-acyltransferase [Parvibaculum sp.]MBO6905627.1 acetyl-CoA C-acyltransferase [Parvibaculum sp.]
MSQTSHETDPVVIVSAARTPMGGFQGALSGKTGPELGAIAVQGAVERAGLSPTAVDEVLMGCVLSAGLGQAPARQAALGAGLDMGTPCTTVNKMCGSGMKAVMMAHDAILGGNAEVAVAGGLESMTNAPYLLPKARGGMRLGHGEVKDHMFLDGLEDAYEGRLMGFYAEETAKHYQFTREQQDAYAVGSLSRARKAVEGGTFSHEIVPVEMKTKKGAVEVVNDEQPLTADPEKIPTLKPAFSAGGSVTAANSSSISDGAAALVLMRLSEAERRGLTPLAAIRGQTMHAQEPAWFSTAPVGAISKLMEKTGWSKNEVDLWEVNEAFAVVAMAAIKELGLSHDNMNIYGGACALGHPIGASGARIMVTLLNALKQTDTKRGVASLCIGGGEATAIAIERLN